VKEITYSRGKYSTIEPADGTRFFLEALPDAITFRKVRFKLVPGAIIWQYRFPFYIRTTLESWELSDEIVEIILLCLRDCANESELTGDLNNMTLMLQEWVETNRDRA